MLFKLNDAQLNKLADITSEVALVALASVVLPAIFEEPSFITIILGIAVTAFLWLLSLWILKNK